MSASISHQQHQFAVILIPYQKPIRCDVALPIAFVLSMKNVRVVFLRQTTFCSKYVEYINQRLLIIASLEATFE